MAAAVGVKLVKFALEKVGGAAVSELFKKGIAIAQGGSDVDKVQESVNETLKYVQEIKEAVDEISKKMDAGFVTLRRDNIKVPLDDIDSYFASVQDILQTAITDKKTIHDPSELKEALDRLQTRLEEKLKLAANTVPSCLTHVNEFLTDKTFIEGAANMALQSSSELLSYFMRMQTLFTGYWAIYVKGIALLQMAHLTPKVGFEEGEETVKRLKNKIEEQQTIFEATVGENVCRLAEAMLADSQGRHSYFLYSGWGNGIVLNHKNINSLEKVPVPWVRNDTHIEAFHLEVATPISSDRFDLSKSYPVIIWANGGRLSTSREGDAVPIYISNFQSATDTWFIKPTGPGKDVYRIVGADASNLNKVVVTAWDNFLEYRMNVDVKTGFEGTADRAWYQIYA